MYQSLRAELQPRPVAGLFFMSISAQHRFSSAAGCNLATALAGVDHRQHLRSPSLDMAVEVNRAGSLFRWKLECDLYPSVSGQQFASKCLLQGRKRGRSPHLELRCKIIAKC